MPHPAIELQHLHRGRLRRLGATVCLVPYQAPPARYGRDRDRSVPVASRGSGQGVGLDSEPGKEGAAIFYRQVLKITEPWRTSAASVRHGKRLPGMWTVAEVWATLARIPGRTGLMLRRRLRQRAALDGVRAAAREGGD